MKTKNIRIGSDNFEMIKSIILNGRTPTNIIEFDQGCQIIFEKYSFLNKNNYLDIILLLQHKGYTTLSIASGGASTGLFIKFSWGTENNSIQKIWKSLETWCDENAIHYEIME